MKGAILILQGIFFSSFLFSQDKAVAIRIEQGSSIQSVSGQEINLRKEPFKIVVSLRNLDGVYLFADFTDSIYKLSENEKIPGFNRLPDMAMAETNFNEDQELIINKEGWAYWFYDTKLDWHRFDQNILVTKDSIVGTKTIKQFYFGEPEHTVSIEQISEPLYLFFVAIEKSDKRGSPTKELARMKVKINWE